jgi:outer membrane lipoprotein LolB
VKRSELHASARAALLLATLGVAACVPAVKDLPPGDPVAWEARRVALTAQSAWTMEGRAAIANADDGWSGALTWVQDGEAIDLRFEGPLGFGGLRIRGDAAALAVTTSKGETFDVLDPERDLEAKLGWPLPVRSMRYWVTGIPDPAGEFAADYDAAGRPRRIEQGGWTVRYEGFQPAAAMEMPRRVTIERADLRIKLVAERWAL